MRETTMEFDWRFTCKAAIIIACTATLGVACYSPIDSQKYFAKAAREDPALELIHRTALYTVFYDHALRRCVLHSAHTWGEHGGGGGGTGVGVTEFRCDPSRIKERVKLLDLQIEDIRDPGETPPWEMLHSQNPTGPTPPPATAPPAAKPPAAKPSTTPPAEPVGESQ